MWLPPIKVLCAAWIMTALAPRTSITTGKPEILETSATFAPRSAQPMQPRQDLTVIGTQPCPFHLTRFLIDGMRNHRKCMHIQPDTRTVETHRRPDLQLWLYQCECSLDTGNHVRLQPEAFLSRLHIV